MLYQNKSSIEMKVVNIVGARPNFVKISPLIQAMHKSSFIKPVLLHTGQHYDYNMSENFFNELGIPKPDIYLGVGSASHGKQVAMIMKKFDEYCEEHNPDLVLVVGDVNSTMACSIVAVKRHIKVAHVEAGIRSLDRSMPEEINRIVTDSVSDILMPPTKDAIENLRNEGHSNDKIFLVGNIMIDTLLRQQHKIQKSKILSQFDLRTKEYALLTLHRPSNVDDIIELTNIIDAIENIQQKIKIVFPVHPRTRGKIEEFELSERIDEMKNFIMTDPLGYADFGKLVYDSRFVLTDSGGIQEETTVYNIPCITLRKNTERPVTVWEGTNELAGSNTDLILEFADKILDNNWKSGKVPELWDGKTSERIVDVLAKLNS